MSNLRSPHTKGAAPGTGSGSVWLATAFLIMVSGPALPQVQHELPLVMSASNARQQGFVRIINNSSRSGTVSVHAIDDTGRRFGPSTLSLGANHAVQFNSRDLERGNSTIGLSGGVGDGTGNWRLDLSTTLDIEPLAYIRTPDGFLASMHELASEVEPMRYHVPIFNPGSNLSLVSWLRLINTGDRSVSITITGIDANGNAPPRGSVSLSLRAGAARTLTARQLEEGAPGVSGRFGDGAGKWQLFVSSSARIQVMGLMQTRSGHLTNLSRGVSPGQRTIPLVMSASNARQQGFVRIINNSSRSGTVDIHAIDDTGRRFGPSTLSLGAKDAVQFNSQDLERGNSTIGLSGGVGDGTGNWRLELSTTLDIEPLAYIRTPDGFLTSMHEVASPAGMSMRYRVPIFNPGSNRSLVSLLRLINPGDRPATITITGEDARGNAAPRGDVSLTLGAGAARTLNARQLEEGSSDLSGRLGDGEGKWQLFVSASTPIQVMGLMQTSSGHLSNLSGTSASSGGPSSAPTAFDVPVSTDLTTPYIEAQLIGTDPDGDTLTYVLDGGSSGPGYEFAFVESDTGRLYASLDPGDRDVVRIPYKVSDGTLFSERALVLVTIEDTPTGGLGNNPETPRTYGSFDREYFDAEQLPASVDLSGNFPEAGSQGVQGSCTAWATAYALKSYQERVEEGWTFTENTTFSPAWIYNQINNGQDRGSLISDAFKLMIDRGAATWAAMPYSQHDYLTQPSDAAIREAARYKATGFSTLSSAQQWKAALADRHPVVIGIPIYTNFNGRTVVYNDLRGRIEGYHAVTVTGYDDNQYGGAFRIINSWGRNMHDGQGYFWLPYATLRDPRFGSVSYVLQDGPNDEGGRPPPPQPPPCGSGASLPNLVPVSWSADYDAQPGGQGTWQWEVRNTGSATAPSGVDVNLILSTDRRADVNDYWVAFEEIPFSLAPGRGAVRTDNNELTFRFPTTIPPGTYYMAMWVDDVNEVRECDETDNVSLGINDVVFRFDLPDIAVEHWYAEWDRFGDGSLEYEVVNQGTATITRTDWDINLVLHTRPDPSDSAGDLYFLFFEDAGHVLPPNHIIYRNDRNPARFSVLETFAGYEVPVGVYYMSLWVDDLDEVHESNEWNNVSLGNNQIRISYATPQSGRKQTDDTSQGGSATTLPTTTAGSAFNGEVLPDRLWKKVEIVEQDDGTRRVVFLGEEQYAEAPATTVGQPRHGKSDASTQFEKTNMSEDIVTFPGSDVRPMP